MNFLLTLIKFKTIKEKTVNKYSIYRSKIKVVVVQNKAYQSK